MGDLSVFRNGERQIVEVLQEWLGYLKAGKTHKVEQYIEIAIKEIQASEQAFADNPEAGIEHAEKAISDIKEKTTSKKKKAETTEDVEGVF